jgi:tetratricopeptide (TPR) repeat protein
MKIVVLICAVIIMLTAPIYAADDTIISAMKLYKKHFYTDAFNVVYNSIASGASNDQDKIHLSLGMICLANAKLYRELYHISTPVHLNYLTRLYTADLKSGSRFVKLYLGHTLLEADEFVESAAFYKKFIADEKVSSQAKAVAKVGLGSAFFLQGKQDQARNLWAKLIVSEPEVLSALAAAYIRIGLMEKKPSAMCQQVFELLKDANKKPSIDIINNIIEVYAMEGQIEDGFNLLGLVDLKAFFDEETLIKNKVIRFYNPALLRNLSLLFAKASVEYLAKASLAADAKVKGMAQYYQALGLSQLGQLDRSSKIIDSVISSAQIPLQLKNKAKVRQAVNNYLLGHKTIAKEQFDTLLQSKAKPDLVAHILLACTQHNIDYQQAVINATALAQKGEGKSFAQLNFALGKYYLAKKDYFKATAYMEAGRDKSNKNRIEYNDPLMLVNLADAYYSTKQFSEALEIYFEMGKQFPAVRQIQIALQGVYSMEQKSAGDAKIF